MSKKKARKADTAPASPVPPTEAELEIKAKIAEQREKLRQLRLQAKQQTHLMPLLLAELDRLDRKIAPLQTRRDAVALAIDDVNVSGSTDYRLRAPRKPKTTE